MMIYGYPNVGHSLLAWARCTVWCSKNKATMLGPIWLRPRIGSYLRGERDKREYFRLFTNRHYPNRFLRTRLLLTGHKVPAEAQMPIEEMGDGTVVVFTNRYERNFENHFHEIVGYHEMLLGALQKITRQQYLPQPTGSPPFLAIHVRMGDFQPFDPNAAAKGTHNLQLPLEWYQEALAELRNALVQDLPARVYSDGTDADLKPLLAMPGVERAANGSAITHLLEMTQAAGLIAAGSGFSYWSSFLGQVPRIVFPGQGFEEVENPMPTTCWSSQTTDGLDSSITHLIESRI